MILNQKFELPPKWSRLEPSDRNRRGRPTEKRVKRLKEASGETDAITSPDKAPPRAPLRVRKMDWAPQVPTTPKSDVKSSDEQQLVYKTLALGFGKKSGRGKKVILSGSFALACSCM